MTVGASMAISPVAMPASTEDSESSPSSSVGSPNNQQLLFRKHKMLPHPRRDASYGSLRSSRPLASIQKYDVGHAAAAYGATTTLLNGSIATDEAVSINSLPSSPRTLKHYPKKLGSGPDLPPTPPAHSRNSSSSYSALPPAAVDDAPAATQSREISAADAKLRPAPPTTPTTQMSPPTPDVTPPYAAPPEAQPARVMAFRSPARGHDSRTGSFTTAREQPSSGDEDNGVRNEEEDDDEDEEDGHSTLRHIMPPSAKTSQSTVRRVLSENASDTAASSQKQPQSHTHQHQRQRQHHQLQAVGLGLGLESSPEQSSTPRSRRDFVSFDGEWGSSSEEVVQEWDDNLDRNVAVRKRHAPSRNGTISPPLHCDEVVDDLTVPPTNATEALRSMPLPQRILTFPSPTENPLQPKLAVRKPKQYPSLQPQPLLQQQLQQQRMPKQQQQQHQQASPPLASHPLASAAPITASQTRSISDSSSDKDKLDRRVSTMSSKSAKSTRSTVSTVVEAFVIDTTPQRRRTLRHVRKQGTLRDSSSDLSPASSIATSLLMDESGRQRRPTSNRYSGNGHESLVSTTTATSVSSRSARREIIKAGGIPVVVVPERLSSVRSSSREPSLRSTSSRRSKKSKSQSPNPRSQFSSSSREPSAHQERDQVRGRDRSVARRGRRLSDSDGSAPGDQRTIDYPPVVPRRTSSLSAPTSRNASRSGSLTSESVHAHSALLESRLREHERSQAYSQNNLVKQSRRPELLSARQQEQDRTPTQDSLPIQTSATQTPILTREDNEPDIQEGFHTPREIAYSNTTVHNVPLGDAPTSPRQHDRESNHEQNEYYRNMEYSDRLDSKSSFDRHGDFLGKHLSPQNTPFSMASVDTTTTHHSQAEVSEALAVSIYPHQNTSVLVVDHSNRPSESSDDSQRDHLTDVTERSLSRDVAPSASVSASTQDSGLYTTAPVKQERSPFHRQATVSEPVTPPQPQYAMEDVDSPLRNPRIPPEPPIINEPEAPPGPPAINFIPATPSGMTPAPALEQRNRLVIDEDPEEERPRRSMSLVLRRALNRGRRTEYGPSSSRSAGISARSGSGDSGGILSRTLSLTRSLPRRSLSRRRSASVDRDDMSSDEDEPTEADKLHPLWRPASYFHSGEADKYSRDQDEEGETYRYPPIDNRPHRSISSRVKRTFAILPIEAADDFYPATSDDGPERRTVRRTASGNLRVVKHRSSVDSVPQGASQDATRPYTAPEAQGYRKFWRSPSFGKNKEVFSPESTNSLDVSSSRDTASRDMNANSTVARNASVSVKKTKILPTLGSKIGDGLHTIPRRLSERRREKRSNELRQKISGPREVRDGVGEVIRPGGYTKQRDTRGSYHDSQNGSNHPVSRDINQPANYNTSHNSGHSSNRNNGCGSTRDNARVNNYDSNYDSHYGSNHGASYYDNCRIPNRTSYRGSSQSSSHENYQNEYPRNYQNNYLNGYEKTSSNDYRSHYRSKYTYAPARTQNYVSGH